MKRIVAVVMLVCIVFMSSCSENKSKGNTERYEADGMVYRLRKSVEIIWIPYYNPSTGTNTIRPILVPKESEEE